MKPRDLRPIRNTHVHSAPVWGYKLDFELNYIPQGPLDLSKYGLQVAAFGNAPTARADLGDHLIGVYVDAAKQVWLCVVKHPEFQPYLFPFPWERDRFEEGDEVCMDRPGVDPYGKPNIKCGKISRAFPGSADLRCFQDPNFHETPLVRWDGEEGESMASDSFIRLRRNEPCWPS